MRIARSIVAVASGCVLAGFVVFAIELLGHWCFPPPANVDLSDAAALAAIMDQIPLGAMLFVLAGWSLAMFVGAAVAAWVSLQYPLIHGLVPAGVMLSVGVATMLAIPHPLWFWIAVLMLSPISAWLGVRAGAAAKYPQGSGRAIR